MTPVYNPYDWYWLVNGGETRFWSSKSSSYVTVLPKDAGFTRIASEIELSEVLAPYGLKGPVDIVPVSVPMWAVRTVLAEDGLFDQADALVKASNDIALKNVWEYGNFADRTSASIVSLGTALGLTEAQIDQMFIDAGALKP